MSTAATFRQLHAGPALLLLANCWDAGSARLIESLGAPALATTSAGLAWALGYPDGDALPTERLIAAVASIARVVRVPVSVDMEGGYASDPAVVGKLVAALVDAGAVGINIEDGGDSPDLLAAKIERCKAAAAQRGVDLFVNARTDIYLRGLVPESARIAATLERAKQYQAAGADGLFVPKVVQPDAIRAISAGTTLPLNVLAWPGLPDPKALGELGVRRLSAGSGIAQDAWNRAAMLARQFLAEGQLRPTDNPQPLSYGEINSLFAARK